MNINENPEWILVGKKRPEGLNDDDLVLVVHPNSGVYTDVVKNIKQYKSIERLLVIKTLEPEWMFFQHVVHSDSIRKAPIKGTVLGPVDGVWSKSPKWLMERDHYLAKETWKEISEEKAEKLLAETAPHKLFVNKLNGRLLKISRKGQAFVDHCGEWVQAPKTEKASKGYKAPSDPWQQITVQEAEETLAERKPDCLYFALSPNNCEVRKLPLGKNTLSGKGGRWVEEVEKTHDRAFYLANDCWTRIGEGLAEKILEKTDPKFSYFKDCECGELMKIDRDGRNWDGLDGEWQIRDFDKSSTREDFLGSMAWEEIGEEEAEKLLKETAPRCYRYKTDAKELRKVYEHSGDVLAYCHEELRWYYADEDFPEDIEDSPAWVRVSEETMDKLLERSKILEKDKVELKPWKYARGADYRHKGNNIVYSVCSHRPGAVRFYGRKKWVTMEQLMQHWEYAYIPHDVDPHSDEVEWRPCGDVDNE